MSLSAIAQQEPDFHGPMAPQEEDLRHRLLGTLTNLFVSQTQHSLDEILQFEAAIEGLLPQSKDDVRLAAAQTLADYAWCPPGVMNAFLASGGETAAPFLRRSRWCASPMGQCVPHVWLHQVGTQHRMGEQKNLTWRSQNNHGGHTGPAHHSAQAFGIGQTQSGLQRRCLQALWPTILCWPGTWKVTGIHARCKRWRLRQYHPPITTTRKANTGHFSRSTYTLKKAFTCTCHMGS
jgi:hypothetical protein